LSSDFSYTVKFQRRKTLGLYVLPDGAIEVRAPMRTAQRTIVAFVEQRVDWVLKTRARQLQRQQWQLPVEDSGSTWFLGEPRTLEIRQASVAAIECDGPRLVVGLRDPDNREQLERRLSIWYRDQAEAIFSERLLLVCQPRNCGCGACAGVGVVAVAAAV
jgi:predicted metal-dependent hydrolase